IPTCEGACACPALPLAKSRRLLTQRQPRRNNDAGSEAPLGRPALFSAAGRIEAIPRAALSRGLALRTTPDSRAQLCPPANPDPSMPSPRDTAEVTGTARMLVVLLAFAWGLNWISVSIGLRGAPPWTLRFLGAGLGALALIVAATLSGHTLRVPRGERVHVMVAGFLNVALFQILSTFAQLNGATSRVIILAYSMPIWTTIMGRLVLGERLTRMRRIAIALCIVGLAILVWPLFAHGIPITVVLGLACAWCWCGATVYLKWVKATVPPLANAAWQLVFGFLFIAGGTFIFEGVPHVNGISRDTWLAILFM